MSWTVKRFELLMPRTKLELPANAHCLSADWRGPMLFMWVWLDVHAPTIPRYFAVVETGELAPGFGAAGGASHVATVHGGLHTQHVFEVPTPSGDGAES